MTSYNPIVATLTYFDLLEYPLTLHELWRWQWGGKTTHLGYIAAALQGTVAPKAIRTKDGLFFLNARTNLPAIRRARYEESMRKWGRIRFAVWILKHVPFLRAVFLTNRLAYENADDASDIDLFCVADAWHIWTVRFFAAGVMKLLNLRPKPGRSKNGICLSFFVTTDHLDLRPFLLAPLVEHGQLVPDIQFIYWLSQFYPVYSERNTKEQFWSANRWVCTYLPNHFFSDTGELFRVSWPKRLLEWKLSLFGSMFETFFRRFQLFILPDRLRSMMNHDTRVVMNTHVLKLHANDRREEYQKKFVERLYEHASSH